MPKKITVHCDGCQASRSHGAEWETTDKKPFFRAWLTKEAIEEGWIEKGEEDYCPECAKEHK
ncbi:MAG: hypothetical protein LBV13_01235 [Methanomassiliicoccaceae archaeon]|jgi:ribosomal protein L44E|nr:hypothetical protein [Methanomassiliicoccaceae archaeon]